MFPMLLVKSLLKFVIGHRIFKLVDLGFIRQWLAWKGLSFVRLCLPDMRLSSNVLPFRLRMQLLCSG